jgi:hypothetical protein
VSKDSSYASKLSIPSQNRKDAQIKVEIATYASKLSISSQNRKDAQIKV